MITAGDLINFINKNNPILLNTMDRFVHHCIHVNQFIGFFLGQHLYGLRNLEATVLRLFGHNI